MDAAHNVRGGQGASEILLAPDGTLILPFHGWSNAPEDANDRRMQWWTVVSRNGGVKLEASSPGPKPRVEKGFEPGGAGRAAIDVSNGPHRGRIFLTFPEGRDGKMWLQVVYSDDQGKTWSDPKVIDSGEHLGASNLTLAVNKNGILAALWLDRRADTTKRCHLLYLSASVDGGDTWITPVRAHERPTCMRTRGNAQPVLTGVFRVMEQGRALALVSPTSAADRFSNGGDTQGLQADAAGVFHAATTGGDKGTSQIWYTSFTVEGGPAVAATPAAAKEVSDDLLLNDLQLSTASPHIDFDKRTMALDVYITNTSRRTYKGPFTLTVT